MKSVLENKIEPFLEYLLSIKNYSKLTILTYDKTLQDAVEVSEIYEEDNVVVFDIRKYRLKISFLENSTISKKVSTIKSFVKFLKLQKINIKLIGAQAPKRAKSLPKPVDDIKIKEALEVATSLQKISVLLLYSLGLRISELIDMRVEDISSEWISVVGKGSKQRDIPMNSLLQQELLLYLQENRPKIYLFEQESGKRYSVSQIRYQIKKLFEKIGLKVTPHQLRHSFATELLNSGARINDISELLGHSSINSTSIYTKLANSTKMQNYKDAHPLLK
jgi:integrase/recombinase XerC